VRIAWEALGDGDALLLIHGLGYDRDGWGPALYLLARQFEVVAFDNRGVGRSDRPPGPYTTTAMADDAAAVLDAAGVSRAHVLGTSLGGMIAQDLALRHRERVQSIVLSSTTPGGERAYPTPQVTVDLFAAFAADPSAEQLLRLVENALSPETVSSRPELVEEILRYRLEHAPAPEPWLAQAEAGRTFSSLDALPRLALPCLVTHGTDDNVVDHRNAELLVRALPHAELHLMPKTGHLGFWERASEFAARVSDFLGRHGSTQ